MNNVNVQMLAKSPLKQKYSHLFSQIVQLSKSPSKIDETNVYQEANIQTRKIMDAMVKENLLPGSTLMGVENFKTFYDALKSGRRALILMEHYSNMDLPLLFYMLSIHSEWAKDLSQRIVAIAGMKLNESSPYVKAFAEAFSRVVIYPTRSLEQAKDIEHEEIRARKINISAMHAMDNCKRRGQAILVFPSGTRYRPGHPETKRGLREIDSYLRMFDIMILVTINGCCLQIDMDNPNDMLADLVGPDKMILTASPVLECKSFRKNILQSLPETEPDPKQKIIDNIMQRFEEQHNSIEKIRINS